MKTRLDIPTHIRQLAEDASTDARGVLADWFEEQDDHATAAKLREGGMAAHIAMLSLFGGAPGKRNDAVIIDGRLVFQWCDVDLILSVEREPAFDYETSLNGSVRRLFRTGSTTARAHVVGSPKSPLPGDFVHPDMEVVFMVRDTLVVVRPFQWNYRQDSRNRMVIHLDIEGHVTSHELVNREDGTVTALR